MRAIVLDGCAGVLYLFHKVFSDLVEVARGRDSRLFWKFRLAAAVAYLAGIAPTVWVFWQTQRLTFGAIELGGIPAMIGAIVAANKEKDPPKWLSLFAALMVPLGMWYAALHPVARNLPRALELAARWLELAGALSFLVGVFLQMFQNKSVARWAYAFFFFMNVATGALMAIDGRWLWVPQQATSIVLILDALMGAPLLKSAVARWVRCKERVV